MAETSELRKFGGFSYTPSCLPEENTFEVKRVDPSPVTVTVDEEGNEVLVPVEPSEEQKAEAKEKKALLVNTSLEKKDGEYIAKEEDKLDRVEKPVQVKDKEVKNESKAK